jgi:TPR repeat protein
MPVLRPVRCVVAAVLTIVVIDSAAAQVPPETSIYELVDVAPPAQPAACACVAGAFRLPAFRPGIGWGHGPAAPVEDAPLAQADRARLAQRLDEQRTRLPREAEDGLAGNAHASLGVAVHLREESLAAGLHDRTEEEAAKWLHLAASQDHRDAFMMLGYRYQRGRGVPQSDEAAAYWFHQGALRSDSTSMMALGLRYATGRGVPQDFRAAVFWWRKAADRTPLASRFLGDAYACGLGADADPERAVREYKKAAEAGETSAHIQLGRVLVGGCAPPDDDAAAKAFRHAADAGDPDAQLALSQLVLQGRGVAANAAEAYYWARMAQRRVLPPELQTLAAARVKAAAERLSPDAIAAAEQLVEALITEMRKR